MRNQDIAATQHISEARIKQLLSECRRTGTAHQLKSPGRPAKGPLSLSEEQVIVDEFYSRLDKGGRTYQCLSDLVTNHDKSKHETIV